MDNAVDDPLDFKAGPLQTLDENFRCPICKEFYDTAMILSTCSHSFCAICIRRSLAAEQCCPKCRKPCHDSNLYNNYDLDNVIHAWKLSRQLILGLEEATASGTTTEQFTIKQQASTTNDLSSNDDSDFIDRPLPPFVEQSQDTSISRRSSRLKVVTSQSEDPNLVTCPICQQKMNMEVLNQHVDLCLNGDSTIPPLPNRTTIPQLQPKQINTGKKPIKIVYDMYKEKDLRRMLKNLNLPDHGDKSLLVWRYKEYMTLYNANMDSPNPVDISKVIHELQKAESLQLSRMTTKRSAPDVNDHKQKYVNEYKDLIEQARKKPNNRPAAGTGEPSTSTQTITPSSTDDFQ